MARGVVALAGGGDHLLARWAELAQALGGTFTQEAGHVHVELPDGSPALSLSTEPARTAPRLGEGLGEALAQLMPAWARCDGNEIAVTLVGAEPDRNQLERAMSLARSLATPRGGTYRGR